MPKSSIQNLAMRFHRSLRVRSHKVSIIPTMSESPIERGTKSQ